MISVGIILAATSLARRSPSLAGLIGVMPLAGALILAWVYLDNQGNPALVENYVKGALLGIAPSILFYLAVFQGVKRGLSLPLVMIVGFGVWLAAAAIHQWALK